MRPCGWHPVFGQRAQVPLPELAQKDQARIGCPQALVCPVGNRSLAYLGDVVPNREVVAATQLDVIHAAATGSDRLTGIGYRPREVERILVKMDLVGTPFGT